LWLTGTTTNASILGKAEFMTTIKTSIVGKTIAHVRYLF